TGFSSPIASTQCRIIGWFTGSGASCGGPMTFPSYDFSRASSSADAVAGSSVVVISPRSRCFAPGRTYPRPAHRSLRAGIPGSRSLGSSRLPHHLEAGRRHDLAQDLQHASPERVDLGRARRPLDLAAQRGAGCSGAEIARRTEDPEKGATHVDLGLHAEHLRRRRVSGTEPITGDGVGHAPVDEPERFELGVRTRQLELDPRLLDHRSSVTGISGLTPLAHFVVEVIGTSGKCREPDPLVVELLGDELPAA